MLNRTPLKDRARGRWSGILPALGIGESFLTGKHGPCPLCGGKDRWRWDNLEGRGTWICSKCGAGDGVQLVIRKNGWEFHEAAKLIESVIGSAPADTPRRERSDRDKRDAMNKLWRSSKTIQTNDPAGRYLFHRIGLTSFPTCLRIAYDVRYQSDCPSFHPAMIAMVTAPDGSPSILHRTYLTNDGRKAPVTEPRRLMPGLIAKGAAIRLGTAGDMLGIAEGIETALSATALFGVPCWAAVSAALLATWQPPPEAKRIIIFGDNDPSYAGQTRLMRLPDGSGRMSAWSRFRSPPRSAPTGMMCINCAGTIWPEATMAERIGRGSLTGRWEPRPGGPNIRGGITLARDVPANSTLWLTGWTKMIAGGEFVSVLVEIADKGGRPSR